MLFCFRKDGLVEHLKEVEAERKGDEDSHAWT